MSGANSTATTGIASIIFTSSSESDDTILIDFQNKQIKSSIDLQLIQSREHDYFTVKIPEELSHTKVFLTSNLINSGKQVGYRLNDQSLHTFESNPLCISLHQIKGFTKLSFFSGGSKAISNFTFYVQCGSTDQNSINPDNESKSQAQPVAFPVPEITLVDEKQKCPFPVPLKDGPAFRHALSEYEYKIPRLINSLSRSRESMEAFQNILTEASEAKKLLIHHIKEVIRFSIPCAVSDRMTEGVIDNEIIQKVDNLVPKDMHVLNDVDKTLHSKLFSTEALNARKKTFEDESKKFYESLSKALGSGRDRDEKLLRKRKQFEVAKIDYLMFLFNTILSVSFKFVSPTAKAQNFVREHYDLKKARDSYKKQVIHSTTFTEFQNVISQYSTPVPGKQSGILFTHGGQGKSGWHKQWVVLENGKLTEYTDWRRGTTPRNQPIDISLCNIKPMDVDKRRNCFRLMTSTGMERYFQAIDTNDRDVWVQALFDAGQQIRFHRNSKNRIAGKNQTELEINNDSQSRRVSSVSLANLRTVQAASPSNLVCCDCGSSEGVEWISINLLVVFCINCSSCHRSLGTSISKVRSLKLDSFNNESSELLKHINNSLSNSYYESKMPHPSKINSTVDNSRRLQYIKNKYMKKAWVKDMTPNEASDLLIRGVKNHNIADILLAIAGGADVNMKLSEADDNNDDKLVVFSIFEYALEHPTFSRLDHHPIYDTAELLILNGANLTNKENCHIKLSETASKYWETRLNKRRGIENHTSPSSKINYSRPEMSVSHSLLHRNGSHKHGLNIGSVQSISRSHGLRSSREKINNLLRIKNRN